MWDYSEKVKEHFYNPRNAGNLDQANGVGEVGSMACGDALRLTLDVDPDTETIRDAKFQTFGCGSAIASSSALTEMVKGLNLDQALEITNQDIAEYLDGLPPEKMHCSVMGREALQAAVANYRGEVWSDDHDEGALVCKCFAIDEPKILRTIEDNKLTTVEDVINYTKAGGGCGCCMEPIEKLLIQVNGSLAGSSKVVSADAEEASPGPVVLPQVAAAPLDSPAKTAPAGAGAMSSFQKIRRIEQAIEAVRPTLVADGGDIELLDVDDRGVFVRLSGACSGCQLASATLGLVQQRIMELVGEFLPVIPVSETDKVAGVGS